MPRISEWLIKCFLDQRIIREILMSPSQKARNHTVALLIDAIKTQMNYENLDSLQPSSELPSSLVG